MIGQIARPGGEAVMEKPGTALDDERASAAASWLLCQAGSHRFALPMSHVAETMRMLPVEMLAGAPPLVLGLCVIRGAPTPVLDAAMLFEDRPGRCERLVTLRIGSRIVALAALAVLGVYAVPAEELDKLPPLLGDVRAVAALKVLDQDLVFFLHAARIVPDDVLDRCLGAVA